MSILSNHEQGWVISHLDFINQMYEKVEDAGEIKSFEFNPIFFNINSPFWRLNQMHKIKESTATESLLNHKKRKRNKSVLAPQDIIDQNDDLKRISEIIIIEAQNLGLLSEITEEDNNEDARKAANNSHQTEQTFSPNFYGKNDKNVAVTCEFNSKKVLLPANCTFYCYDIKEMCHRIQPGVYFDLILMDPPWWNKAVRRKKSRIKEDGYEMIYNTDLLQVPIETLLTPKGIITVWCTNSSSHLKSILEDIFPKWNLKLIAKWFWIKVTRGGKLICEFNSNSSGKQPYEILLIAARKDNEIKPIDQHVFISIPSSIHSHKPPVLEILKAFLPDNPRCLEIFARYLLADWTSWGLEVLKFQSKLFYQSQS